MKNAVIAIGLLSAIYATVFLTRDDDKDAMNRPLMPTPEIYLSGIDPFAGLPQDRHNPNMSIFYATDRAVDPSSPSVYGEAPSGTMSLGECDVKMVSKYKSWEKMSKATLSANRDDDFSLHLDSIHPQAQIDMASKNSESLDGDVKEFIDALNADINLHRDKNLNIFVHGAKMQFANAMTMAADYHHYCGRRATWLAFAWPAHPYIYQYALGEDDERIVESAHHFARLLELLGKHSDAKTINIICWSAGGRLVGDTLLELHALNPDKTPEQIRQDYKLGHIIFCSSDESYHSFMAKMQRYHDIPEAITYTLTDNDIVLELSALINDDTPRVGDADSDDLRVLSSQLQAMKNVSVLDVSYAKNKRGFDITGHRLWLKQPWVSSDIILNLLTDWSPEKRGLIPTQHPNIWGMTDAYPDRAQSAATEYFTPHP